MYALTIHSSNNHIGQFIGVYSTIELAQKASENHNMSGNENEFFTYPKNKELVWKVFNRGDLHIAYFYNRADGKLNSFRIYEIKIDSCELEN